MIEANKLVLKDSPIFSENFSDEIITKTVSLIKEFRCTPDSIIFKEGQADDKSIYFIQKGKVKLFIKRVNKENLNIKIQLFQ